jgi:hypothetical protein
MSFPVDEDVSIVAVLQLEDVRNDRVRRKRLNERFLRLAELARVGRTVGLVFLCVSFVREEREGGKGRTFTKWS